MNEQRTKRRMKLASRQLTLAKIARREAMASLADAVAEESRSAALSQRSRDLLKQYAKRSAAQDGQALRSNAGFVARLQEVADQAGKALNDASDQARWQVQTLAKAENRASRFGEQLDSAQRDLEAIKSARVDAQTGQMARKLHSKSETAGDD